MKFFTNNFENTFDSVIVKMELEKKILMTLNVCLSSGSIDFSFPSHEKNMIFLHLFMCDVSDPSLNKVQNISRQVHFVFPFFFCFRVPT